MGDTPVYAFPYPEPTDQVMDGADNIKALAESVEAALVAGELDALPKGYLGHAQVTANQAGISGITDLTGLEVTVDLPANRRIRVSAVVMGNQNTSAAYPEVHIYEGATDLTRITQYVSASGTNGFHPAIILEPSAGVHTYKLRAATGPGTLTILAGATYPAFILVEDIGST
jgi:hypothetical protein